MKRHVALAGFMASGKTTIGRKLARKLGYAFCDTDALVVRDHGAIAEIFAAEGEAAFRRYESDAIEAALRAPAPSVIALGGGALTGAHNRDLLEARAHRFFIKLSPEQLLARIRRSRSVRPMLGETPTLARIRELYAQRLPDYQRVDYVVDASCKSDAQVIAEIEGWLAARGAARDCALP